MNAVLQDILNFLLPPRCMCCGKIMFDEMAFVRSVLIKLHLSALLIVRIAVCRLLMLPP